MVEIGLRCGALVAQVVEDLACWLEVHGSKRNHHCAANVGSLGMAINPTPQSTEPLHDPKPSLKPSLKIVTGRAADVKPVPDIADQMIDPYNKQEKK